MVTIKGRRVDAAGRILAEVCAGDTDLVVDGEQEWAWPVLCWTLDTDHGFRVGFEDVLTGPDGEQVSGDAELLAAALELRRTTP